MSTSIVGNAAIGLRVFYEQVYCEVKVKAFDHEYPEDWIADPRTGKKLWQYDTLERDGFNTAEMLFCNKYVILPIMGKSNEDYLIALDYSRTDDQYGYEQVSFSFLNLETLTNRFEEFKLLAIEKNVWNPKYFGLWSFVNYF